MIDLDKSPKARLPYAMPDGMLDGLKVSVPAIARRRQLQRRIWWMSAAAAVTVLLTVGIGLFTKPVAQPEPNLMAAYDALSDDDCQLVSDLYEADVFLNSDYLPQQ